MKVKVLPYLKLVSDFHVKYGHYLIPNGIFSVPLEAIKAAVGSKIPAEVKLLRLRLIQEELGELYEAHEEVDEDRYLEQIADAVADLAYVILGTAVSYGFVLDEIEGKVSKLSDEIIMGRLAVAIHEDQLEIVKEQLSQLLLCCLDYASIHAFNFDLVFREIHRSNMTKATPAEKFLLGSKYGSKTGKGPSYEPPNLKPILKLGVAKHAQP